MGCSEDLAERALDVLMRQGIFIALSLDGEEILSAVSILEGALPLLEERLLGVSLPSLPGELSQAGRDESDSQLCRTLAVAGLMGHRRLRFTKSNDPDRTTMKRFGKGLGPAPDELYGLCRSAIRSELVGAAQDRLVPRAKAILALSRRAEADTSEDPRLVSGEWISLEALLRSEVRRRYQAWPGKPTGDDPGNIVAAGIAPFYPACRERLEAAAGVEIRKVGADTWMRRRRITSERTGDGHVTSSFEVMLGPAAHPEIVATVALGCQLQRIDRVLTFKITPESVGHGRVAGLESGELHAALDRVGRHAVPDNVAQLVDEWDAASKVVPVAQGWFVFAGAELQPLLEKSELRRYIQGSPMHGVLELDASTPRQLLIETLGEHRVSVSLSYPMHEAQIQRDAESLSSRSPYGADEFEDEFDDEFESEFDCPTGLGEIDDSKPVDVVDPTWPLAPAGAPELRERIERARAEGFEADLTRRTEPDTISPARFGDLSELHEVSALIEPFEREAARELARFGRKLGGDKRESFEEARGAGVELAPFLALKPKWRRRIANAAVSLEDLIALSFEALDLGRYTEKGARMLERLYETPSIRDGTKDLGVETETIVELAYDAPVRRGRAKAKAEPAPLTFPVMDSHELLLTLSKLVDHHSRIHVLVEAGDDFQVRTLKAQGVRIQGDRQVLLGIDCETLDGVVIGVRTIRSVLRA
jgi:hypothetical protein